MKKTRTNNGESFQGVPRRSQPLFASKTEYDDQSMQEEEEIPEEGQDPMLHPPLWLFIFGGFETIWGAASNILQVITSWAGIIGWQQHDLIATYGVTKGSAMALTQNLGFGLVAAVLSIGAQVGIQSFTQQISRAWKEKRVVEHESTRQALIEIVSGLSIGQLFGYASILVCAWSDYTYVTQIDATGSLGSYILMVFWGLILGSSSTYVLTDGIQRVWSGTLALRAWSMWQNALKAHFEELARQYQPS